MSKAISLHIGMNKVDPAHYGSEARLAGCINDANAMQAIAKARGFSATLLSNEQGTSRALFDYFRAAARDLRSGDTLFVSYAGHGSQVPDLNHDEVPNDKDQTWCVFDRMIVDDELAEEWSRFRAGVRILVVSDSCHSATVARNLELLSAQKATYRSTAPVAAGGPLIGDLFGNDQVLGYRTLPVPTAEYANRAHRGYYAEIQHATRGSENVAVHATVVTLSACRDEETAADGSGHGLYTSKLLDVWNGSAFRGTYRQFQDAIARAVGERQHPQYRITGARNDSFEREAPFTVSSTPTKGEKKVNNENTSLDDRLAALKGGSRQLHEPSGGDMCVFELKVPRQFVIDVSEQEAFNFLRNDGADAMMKAVLGAREISLPRGETRGEISCKVDSGGRVECGIKIGF